MIPARPFYCLWILVVCWSLPALAQEGKEKGSQTPAEYSKPLILAHYMPWYTAKPFSNQWPAPKVGMTQVDKFLVESAKWPSSIPAAFPRFDDIYREAGVGEGYPQLPDDSGRTLQTTLQKALNSKAKIIQIATWNDWGEGTQIEPSIEFGYRDLEHMQRVNSNDERRIKKADLRLPITILELRRAKTGIDAQKTLDAISQQIVGGAIDSARQKLEELRSSNGP